MNLIGHHNILKSFQQLIKAQALHHAYLLYGQEHVGKRFLVDCVAKTALCAKRQEDSYCDECASCRQFDLKTHPDMQYLEKEEGKKSITVKQVRILLEHLSQKSLYNGYKIAIIDQAHILNEQASNALLKTIEEPYPRTILFFITPFQEQILPTIRSRCYQIYIPFVDESEIYAFVKADQQLQNAKEISYLTFGRPGFIRKWKTNPDEMNQFIHDAACLLRILESKDVYYRLQMIKNICERDKEMTVNEQRDQIIPVIDRWFFLLHDILQVKVYQKQSRFVSLEREISVIAERYNMVQWQQMTKELFLVRHLLQQNVNIRLTLENYVLSI